MPGSLADILRECRGYVDSLQSRAAELPPHLQEDRAQIIVAVAKTEEAATRKSQYKALMQQATRDQDEGEAECRLLAARVRDSVRGQPEGAQPAEAQQFPPRDPVAQPCPAPHNPQHRSPRSGACLAPGHRPSGGVSTACLPPEFVDGRAAALRAHQ